MIREIRKKYVTPFVKQWGGLVLAVLAALIILLLPKPSPFQFAGQTIILTIEGQRIIALLVMLIVIFITEALPIGATVGVVYAWIIFFEILPPNEAAQIFSHDAAWFLMGSLMLAQVLIIYGLHKRVLLFIIRVVGSKPKFISLGIIAFCAIGAAFIADYTIAAMMLPIALAIIHINGGFEKDKNLAKLLLLSIAFGCSIGGLGSPAGGGRNVVMLGLLEDFYDVRVGFGAWMVMGFPIVLALIPCVWIILIRVFKPTTTDLKDTVDKVKAEMRTSAPLGTKGWSVIAIFFFTLFLFVTKSDLGIGMLSLLGVTLFLVFRLVEWKDYQKINWGVPLFYFGVLGLGKCLQLTGAATWLGAGALALIDDVIPIEGDMTVTAIGVAIVSLSSQVMGNGPVIATIGPALLEGGNLSGVDPIFSGVAYAMASAFAFMLIIGTPANIIVYSSGYLKSKDFLKAGILTYIIAIIVLLFVVYLWWGFIGVGINGFH